jgi:hypothetical protein
LGGVVAETIIFIIHKGIIKRKIEGLKKGIMNIPSGEPETPFPGIFQ